MNGTKQYPAQVFWSAEDEGFIALAIDLPGCSAIGESQAEALNELQHAIEAWIEAATAAGNAIPPPSPTPEPPRYSGKVMLRMPLELHGRLSQKAEEQRSSLNQYIVYLLASGVAGWERVPTVSSLGSSAQDWAYTLNRDLLLHRWLRASDFHCENYNVGIRTSAMVDPSHIWPLTVDEDEHWTARSVGRFATMSRDDG